MEKNKNKSFFGSWGWLFDWFSVHTIQLLKCCRTSATGSAAILELDFSIINLTGSWRQNKNTKQKYIYWNKCNNLAFFAELIVAHASVYSSRERWCNNSIPHTHTRESGDQSRGFARLACQKTLAITRGPFFLLEISRLVGNWRHHIIAPAAVYTYGIFVFFFSDWVIYYIYAIFPLFKKNRSKRHGMELVEREILFPWKSWAEAERNAISTGGRWRDERAVERSRLPWRRRQAGSQRAGLKNQKHANSFTQRSTTKF